MPRKTPTQRQLQITASPFTLGTYVPSADMIDRMQKREPQCAVMVDPGPDCANGTIGMLVAMCGPAEDGASNREAVLFAASPELFNVVSDLCDLAQAMADNTAGAYPSWEQLNRLDEIIEAARSAKMKAIFDTTVPAEAQRRWDAREIA